MPFSSQDCCLNCRGCRDLVEGAATAGGLEGAQAGATHCGRGQSSRECVGTTHCQGKVEQPSLLPVARASSTAKCPGRVGQSQLFAQWAKEPTVPLHVLRPLSLCPPVSRRSHGGGGREPRIFFSLGLTGFFSAL